ncbi:helix-turn-helix domain-containing protein [Cupriavidus oxalaticus]|uniref:LysR family transcriptional regulator n=1 Tax=Cupriavidus oxalaticus TaxID=96344 RepID=A0A5P3VBX0_9BURK|nr:LysR family transcriptional regulator [Cupriavidus oxalaticus]QEZ43750.1 LysR family transcriptional regulator [Cupriavidus oxalaticus]
MANLVNNRRVSFLSLRAFVALMQHRDTARAAQALGIQTQRLHYQIRGLEAALGTPLFSVGNPSWLPTSTGVKALPKIMAMLRIWEQIEPRPSAGRNGLPPPAFGAAACRGPAFWVRHATM